MPDLLIELRSEEIPACMQRKAAGDLKALVTNGLVEAGLTYGGAREYWTPRRLVLDIRGLDARSKDMVEEKKGPRTDANPKAVEGFLRAAGLASIEEAEVQSDPKKGEFFVARLRKPGRPTETILAALMPAILKDFPWPKSMRWGKPSALPGAFRWVRPLQSIVCTFGPETEEPVTVDFEVGGIASGNVTFGHRFHAPAPIRVRRFDDYAQSLSRAFVVLDAERRKEIIRADAETLAFASGLEVVADEALLEEVAGLVEWPVVLVGSFEEAFLAIPPEVVRLTIKTNQKCFVTRHAGTDKLSNKFLLVANIEASDGGAEIARGNGKVVRARLSDALYFWQTDQADLPDLGGLQASAEKLGLDLSKPLDQRMAKLDALNVTFHAKLGTQGERVQRIAALAETIAPQVGADPALAKRAALLAKADLTTEAVGEFPELQGLMGRYYAGLQGEHPSVQAAIEDHWKPQGPADAVPTDPVAIAVALADKLDTLVGFWAIDEKPTGSKDPYALRRAAIGFTMLVIKNRIKLDFVRLWKSALSLHLGININASEELIIQTYVEMFLSSKSVNAMAYDLYTKYELYLAVINMYCENIYRNEGLLYGILNIDKKISQRSNIFSENDGERNLLQIMNPIILHQADDKNIKDLLYRFNPALYILVLENISEEMKKFHLPDPIDFQVEDVSRAVASLYKMLERDFREFVIDRLKNFLKEGGASHDVVESAVSVGRAGDDLLDIARRVEALGTLLNTEDGRNLLAAYRRAANITAAEEKKGTRIAEDVDPALLLEPQEIALAEAIARAEGDLDAALGVEDYARAAAALGQLRGPADAFFETVLVNAENAAVRANRLALLSRIRTATRRLADFSKIVG